jgi:hypothetical protein
MLYHGATNMLWASSDICATLCVLLYAQHKPWLALKIHVKLSQLGLFWYGTLLGDVQCNSSFGPRESSTRTSRHHSDLLVLWVPICRSSLSAL